MNYNNLDIFYDHEQNTKDCLFQFPILFSIIHYFVTEFEFIEQKISKNA